MSDAPDLREEEIRPEAFRAEQERTLQADIEWLLARRDRFENSRCPMCGADEPRPMWHKHDLDFVRCEPCRTVYLSPRPDPELLAEFFSVSEHYSYWNRVIFPASEEARRTKIFAPRASRVASIAERFGERSGTLVDIGAGYGTFCEEAKALARFDRVIALEPVPELAETCRTKGIETIEGTVESADLAGLGVDVVTCFEVLLHLSAPAEFLRDVWTALPPGGLFVVTTPSSAGFDLVVLGEKSSSVNFYNLNYPTPDALISLLERTGFEVLGCDTPGRLDAELVRKQALDGNSDLSGQPFLHQVLVTEWERVGPAFQAFLAENRLSSHMWCVASKPA